MKNKWFTRQSIIVYAIIILIFAYISCDAFIAKPKMQREIDTIRDEYVEIVKNKLPEIDSTFKHHAQEIEAQRELIKKTFKSE